jgi:hypothetical protein
MATLRDILNRNDLNRLADALQEVGLGELLNTLLSGIASESNTIGSAVTLTVGTALGAFTDPPSAAEMAALRTFVNALKTDAAAMNALLSQLRTAALSVKRATETGVTVTANVATLANQPSSKPFAIVASAGSSTGMKALLVGPISGARAVLPGPGQCVWDGQKKVLFNNADAVTTADFSYPTAADPTASVLNRDIGQNP